MDLFDNLASYGLTISLLQVGIVLGIAVFIIGLYWRYIVAGVGILFCVFVFASPTKQPEVADKQDTKVTETIVEKTSETKVEIKPEAPIVEVKPQVPQTEKEMFMDDCIKYGGYTETQCAALWRDRENDIQSVKWRNQWKKNYFMKVNYVRT